ncbi:LCP family protein [Sediminibacillus halophilus]|uniref:LCP family glycopolymer transferase n=1 Tax=Sediminibacillus halophilus TaxID=482461 RepID=UPI00158716DD|nr:LCP family protein [Sediminibacillus halophilus]
MFYFGKRFVGPILGTFIAVLLLMGIILPKFYQNDGVKQPLSNHASEQEQESSSFSALLMGKDSTENDNVRTTVHILLTYNSTEKTIKLVPIPRDTYVEIYDAEGEKKHEDKLMHAYAFYSSPEAVSATVSNLFDISVDYYSIFSEEEIYGGLGIRDPEKRINHIQLGELLDEQLTFSQLKKIVEESETNIPSDVLTHFKIEESNTDPIEVIDLENGVEETHLNGIYYIKIKQDTIETTTNKLKQHIGNEY